MLFIFNFSKLLRPRVFFIHLNLLIVGEQQPFFSTKSRVFSINDSRRSRFSIPAPKSIHINTHTFNNGCALQTDADQ
jgi:hypothetical protein